MSEIDDTTKLRCDINRFSFISSPLEEQQPTGHERKKSIMQK